MKPRSAFRGASKQDLRSHRAAAIKVARWEAAARAGNFYHLGRWTPLEVEDSRLFHPALVFRAFHERAWRRVIDLPHGKEYWRTSQQADLKESHPDRYEMAKLREEVSSLRAELAADRINGNKGRIPPKQ